MFPRRSWRTYLAGWRRAAAYLIVLIVLLTSFLISILLVSVYGLEGSPQMISDGNGGSTTTLLFRGDCDASTKYNFWGHLLINFVASGVLASSNFFMQVLVAPSREDVDRAHAKGMSLEIGVQSWRNLFHIPVRNAIFWVLLAVSTIPLHLVFNSCILESRASTDFLLLMTLEKFLRGAKWDPAAASRLRKSRDLNPRMNDMQRSLVEDPSRWERMSIEDCYARYNDHSRALFKRRDVIMVLGLDTNDSSNITGTFGWAFNGSAENSVWYYRGYERTDWWVTVTTLRPTSSRNYGFGEDEDGNIDFEASTYTVRNRASRHPAELRRMKVEYCMSEIWTAPCQVEVENTLLFMVVLICALKCGLCITVLAAIGGRTPLITPGDAIESFITKPDPATAGMCTFNCADFDANQSSGGRRSGYQWLPDARPWGWTMLQIPRRCIFAVPWQIWVWSYLLIGVSLCTAAIFVGISVHEQSINESKFGHDPTNRQLILSMCYFAYNGLFTRILSEFEWAKFGTVFRSLRVTHKKGQQRSTYRLRLPYRWSIPLLLVSALLHWLYSNSIYLTIYEGHTFGGITVNRGLAYSSKSIFISFFMSIAVAVAPLLLGIVKLPGNMVVARNGSAAISAACHYIPTPLSHGSKSFETLDEPPLQAKSLMTSTTEYKPVTNAEDVLWDIATGKLKWGVVSPGWAGRVYTESEPGHLAFGSEGQEVPVPVEGSFYAGVKDISGRNVG